MKEYIRSYRNGLRKVLALMLVCLMVSEAESQETERRYLSGRGEDHTVPWEFFCTEGMNSGKWTTIPVPSNWELQGFGKYNYGFNKDENRGKEKGIYRHQFDVPSSWKGKTIRLVFEGVMTDTEARINGQPAGPAHQGSYYRFSYDITSLLHPGRKNLLEVTVSKHSANESVNQAERRGDFWIFGGIFRPVYLEALPAEHIEKISLDADANGEFKAIVSAPGLRGPGIIRAQVYGADGKKAGLPFQAPVSGSASSQLKSKLPSAKLWSPEFPNLYHVVFTLLRNGKAVHSVKKHFGFRTVEVRERDGVYVNGVKVKFKGVNRHSFWPSSGRTLSRRLSEMDVKLMKEMNMNAVRMSHYPADDHFYDLCDSLGLFVMDELAGWHGNYDTETGSKLVKALVETNGHHPSIIMWANGNEGGHNYELDPLFDSLDIQKRPVIHPWEAFRGFDTQHYREFNYGIGNYMHGHNIVMPTEFLHGMWDGGHGAGLEDYWEEMWHYPRSAGGFLWDFSDEGVVRTDKNNMIDTDGNHGADGIVGPYREKEGSFFAIREIWSPIVFEQKDITAAFDGALPLENRFFFTNIDQCSFSWRLTSLPANGRNSSGVVAAPSIKPGEKGKLQIRLPSDWKQYDVLYVTAKDPHHQEIFTWSFPLVLPKQIAGAMVDTTTRGSLTVSETDSLYTVSSAGAQLRFHKRTGQLVEVQNTKGILPFGQGPLLQEGVNNFSNFSLRKMQDKVIITSSFDRKNAYNLLQWTIFPSGWVQMKVNYFPAAYFTNMVGVNFSLPEETIRSVQYMGNGPYRVWKNRMKGNSFGIWTKEYNNSATGEPPFQYPEFKGYHSNLYWARFNTSASPFTVVTETEDLFLRLYTPKVSDDPYNNLQPTFPSGDISFMQGISGIGTKTQKPETTGPMGQKHVYYDYEKDPSRHREIILYFNFSGSPE